MFSSTSRFNSSTKMTLAVHVTILTLLFLTITAQVDSNQEEKNISNVRPVNSKFATRSLVKRAVGPGEKSLICYYDSVSVFRPEKGSLKVEKIDPFLCTHIIFRYIRFGNESLDGSRYELDEVNGVNLLRRLVGLKRSNPDLKILISVNDDSSIFSKMASDIETRSVFITSALRYLDRNGADGVEIVWRYPNDARGKPEDKENLVELLREFKDAFEPRGFILAAAVPVGDRRVRAGYNVAEVSKYLDFINLMSYDYNGGWDSETGLHAPLFRTENFDLSPVEETLNANWSVNYWLLSGAPREKLMLGVTAYGRSFNLVDPNVNGLKAAAEGPAEEGPYTKDNKLLAYNEICELFQTQPDVWTLVRDPNHFSPYVYSGNRWISFEDMDSATLKGRYAGSMGLGGAVVNSMDMDDFSGRCNGGNFPIISTLKRSMFEAAGVNPPQPPVEQPEVASPAPEIPPFNPRPRPTEGPSNRDQTPPDVPIPEGPTGIPSFLARPTRPPNNNFRPPNPPPQPAQVRPTVSPFVNRPPPNPPFVNRPNPNPAPFNPQRQPPTRAPFVPSRDVNPSREVNNLKPIASTSTSRQRLPVCGANGMWYFPGPTCREYFDCTGGSPQLVVCRDNLIWKQSKLWCDFPENVPECVDRA